MAARDGMIGILSQLRRMTATEVDSDTFNGTGLWTDDVLQETVDNYRSIRRYVPLIPAPTYEPVSTVAYYDYFFPADFGRWIETDDTPGAFVITDSKGIPYTAGILDQQYVIDFVENKITFNSDRGGETYYITARTYDLNKAAADVWLTKANLRAGLISWKTDNHTLHEDQEYQHCLEQYRFYSSRSALSGGGAFAVTQMYRSDTMPFVRKHRSNTSWRR